ncbi:MAG: hypothetical protein ABIH65_00065 [Nanoarchaeota archaeon]
MEEFDSYKEVKYLLAWFTLISITIGIAVFLKVETTSIIYLVIIVILLIYSYLKSKETDHYKNQVINLEKEKNGTKKKK